MHAVTIRRLIVFGVCALGVGSLYLVPGIARSPEQIRNSGASEEPIDGAGGVRPATPTESASTTGNDDSVVETDREPAETASSAQPKQPPAARTKGRSDSGDDRASGKATTEESAEDKDSEPPQPVADIDPSKVTPKKLTITWPAAKDNVGVIGYRVWLNGFEVATTAETKANLRWFNNDSGHHVVQVRAIDAAGNQSGSSPTLMIRRPSPKPTATPTPKPSDSPTPNGESSEPRRPSAQAAESPSGESTTSSGESTTSSGEPTKSSGESTTSGGEPTKSKSASKDEDS